MDSDGRHCFAVPPTGRMGHASQYEASGPPSRQHPFFLLRGLISLNTGSFFGVRPHGLPLGLAGMVVAAVCSAASSFPACAETFFAVRREDGQRGDGLLPLL